MNDLRDWLADAGLESIYETLNREDIDLELVTSLSDADMQGLGLTLGQRMKLTQLISDHTAHLRRLKSDLKKRTEVERRQLTVMYCDVVDSTNMVVQLDPEEYRELIDEYRFVCERAISKGGGHIAQYAGDGILAYFGYPQADERDAEHAIQSGLELITSVGHVRQSSGHPLYVRVGIATGEIVVGDVIDTGFTREHSVHGFAPHLAARLQGVAAPDGVLVANTTFRIAQDAFDFEDAGAVDLRGFTDPVQTWKVTGIKSPENRFSMRLDRAKLTPIYGRNHEISKFDEIWAKTCNGQGQVCCFEGPPGIGKSRLIQEISANTEQRPIQKFMFGTPHAEATAWSPAVDLLRRTLGISNHDSADVAVSKLDGMLDKITLDRAQAVPVLANLLSLPLDPAFKGIDLSPERRLELTFQVLESWFANLAAPSLLLICEDVHWFDPTTLMLLNRLIANAPNTPICIVLTTRPGFEFTAGLGENSTHFPLQRLSASSASPMVQKLDTQSALPPELVEEIVKKSDGTPFYIEQLARVAIRQLKNNPTQDAVRKIAIPETLQDSLMAQLDRLAEAKVVAQLAAVLGREFSSEILSKMLPEQSGSLDTMLATLIDEEIIAPQEFNSDSQFVFRHALLQEAAYASLLKSRRRTLHSHVSSVLIDDYADIAEQQPETVARHLGLGGEILKAGSYWLTAARRMASQAAHLEALKQIETALRDLDTLPNSVERDELEVQLLLQRGLSITSTQGYAAPDLEVTYKKAQQLCEQLGNSSELYPVLHGLWRYALVRDELDWAHELANDCLEFAKRSGDVVHQIEAYTALGYSLAYTAQFEQADKALDASLSAYHSSNYETLEFITPQDPAVATYALQAMVKSVLGFPERGRECAEKAIQHAEHLKQPFSVSFAKGYAAFLYGLQRDYPQSAAHGQSGIQTSTDYGFDVWTLVNTIHTSIATASLSDDDATTSIATLGTCLDYWRGGGAETFRPYFLFGLASAHLQVGQIDDGLARVDEALEHSTKYGELFCDAALLWLKGQLLLALRPNDKSSAQSAFRDAVTVARTQNAKLFELRAQTALCRTAVDTAQHPAEHEQLTRLISLFPATDICPDLIEAKDVVAHAL